MSQLNFLVCIISLLVSVAFYTIMERKFLSYIQLRKGPNKTGLMGILQPFSDAIKLFNKSPMLLTTANTTPMYISPPFSLMLSFLMIPLIPLTNYNTSDSSLNSLIFLLISSLTVYTIMMIGWAPNSKYSHLGAIRSVAQMISYEINMFIFMFMLLLLTHNLSFSSFHLPQKTMWIILGTLPLFTAWMILSLAEVNRTPFDFAEGESELVSGFNTEYSGPLFAMIFLAEYMNMIILSMITTTMFTGSLNNPLSPLTILILTVIFLWTRGTLPRFRYDKLMSLNWKVLLPAILLVTPPLMLFSFTHF